ncbi:matrixin family metalloprotease [Nocardioides sp. Bht2]|uniref:matrixin family metalloprotease n=1 Tax=Nocardioides sp. Bht2 TaxID=3392297 RepID=UPI0039B4895B
MTIYFDGGWDQPLRTYTTIALRDAISPPHTVIQPQIVSSKNSDTDVLLIANHYSTYCQKPWAQSLGAGGFYGLTTCNGSNASGRCSQHEVRLNKHGTDSGGSGLNLYLIVHEMGHAIGLDHRNAEVGVMTSNNTGKYKFTSHDKAHVNGASW